MTKKVLVTGGAGFIGSHTVDALLERGDTVRVFDNLTPQVHGENAKRPSFLHKDAEFIQGDVRDRAAFKKALDGIEIVIHDAAEVGVGQSMYSIDQYISTNVGGTGILWDILVNDKNKVEKVLVASSMSNYGEGRYVCKTHGKIAPLPRSEEQMKAGQWEVLCPDCGEPAEAVPTDEAKELNCTSVYAQSKKDQEVYSLMLGEAYQIPTIACRYFNCYGPRQSLNNPYTGAAAIFCSAVKNDKPPLIYEDGHQKRDFVHVKDLVRGKLMLLDSPKAAYDVYNVGRGDPASILDVAETLIEIFGKTFQPDVIGKFRNGDIRHCYADTTKLAALGYQPQISLKQGLEDLVQWSDKQESVSNIEDAHKALVEKGLVR